MLGHRLCIVLLASLALPSTAAAELPGRVGPFIVASDDGEWKLKIGLAAQLQYRLVASDLAHPENRTVDGTVMARRIRPVLSGNLLTRDLSYCLHLSTAPGSVELMDLYLDYAVRPSIRARAGQWKIPFTRFRTGSFKNLTLVDWPVVTEYFGAERQMGIALHNGYERTPRGIQYEVGVFTGVNARGAHAVGLGRLHGEVIENPSDLINPGPTAAVHPELVTHVAYNLGPIDASTDTDWAGGPLRVSGGMSLAWDLDPDRYVDLALRLAPELLIKLRHLSVFAAFYTGFVRRGSVTEQRLGMLGAVFQTSYLFARFFELSVRYAIVQIDGTVATDARVRAANIIAAEKDLDRKKAFTDQYAGAGTTRREHETTVGFNLYIIGRSLKLRTDIGWLAHDRSDGSRNHDLRFQSQLQLAF